MTPFEIVYKVLEIINYVCCGLAASGFIFQFLTLIFAWLKPRTYPHSDKKCKFAIIMLQEMKNLLLVKLSNHF